MGEERGRGMRIKGEKLATERRRDKQAIERMGGERKEIKEKKGEKQTIERTGGEKRG